MMELFKVWAVAFLAFNPTSGEVEFTKVKKYVSQEACETAREEILARYEHDEPARDLVATACGEVWLAPSDE